MRWYYNGHGFPEGNIGDLHLSLDGVHTSPENEASIVID